MNATRSSSGAWAKFLGIGVQGLSLQDLMALLAEQIAAEKKCIIANHNLHSLYLIHNEPKLQEFYEAAEFVHIDGMPIVALARMYGHNVRREQRVTYADWMMPLMESAASHGWRIFYLGSKPEVAETGANRLRSRYPNLQIETRHGYFDSAKDGAENDAVLRAISEYKPHILMVGMGMPRQELWILENLERLPNSIILPSGAAIDYVAGAVPTPPRWAGRVGLEWAFRLFAEPKRLWRRYLLEPWSILGIACKDFAKNAFSSSSTNH